MLRVRAVRKRYDEIVALDGVDLDVAAGEILCLLGPNGAGKTTLVSIVAGLRRADSGTVTVNGVDVVAYPGRAHPFIGLAPQDLGIYPILTVSQNLAYFGELSGVPRRMVSSRVDEVMAAMALLDLCDRPAFRLSGGEKRRLHTAIALMHAPALLLLDEPTAGADVTTRQVLLDVVRDLARNGTAVCYSTHYLQEVESLAASVAILDGGHLKANGPAADLMRAHGMTSLEDMFLKITGRQVDDESDDPR